jgi:hypothetical protein
MLVLLGPAFDGSQASFAKLAAVTGLVVYDLRARIKPGWWGVIRALGDPEQAQDLVARLRKEGFPVVMIATELAWGADRQFVKAQALRLDAEELVLRVRDQDMNLPYAAVLAIVRGEVGSEPRPSVRVRVPSSATFRAVVGATDSAALRDLSGRASDSFQAADVHFHTVRWSARIDPRTTDLSTVPGVTGVPARDLDTVTAELARKTGLRVDQGSRLSSLASYALQGHRGASPMQGSGADLSLDRFDGYSRLVAEAELAALRASR